MTVTRIFWVLIFYILMMVKNAFGSENWIVEPLGNYEIKIKSPDFVGFSALHVSNFGKNLLALTDRSRYFDAIIIRDASFQITDLKIEKSGTLLSSKGEALSGRNTDSEALAVLSNEGFYVSFESNHRVMYHKTLSSAGQFLPKHPDFENFHFNKGLESLATDSNGTLYAIPESPPTGESTYPIYKLNNKKWEVIAKIKPTQDFLISDAYFMPNNDLLLLERAYDWSSGFRTQLRVLKIYGNTIKKQYKILELESGKYNHEGVSVWKNEFGSYFLTIISDNNFIPFITTEIREFKLLNGNKK